MALPQRTKIFLVIFILIALAVIAYLAVFGRALLQNENHGAIFFSLPQALAGKAAAIGNGQYLSKEPQPFIKEMESQGFKFTEQMGAGYIFTKDRQNYVSTSWMSSSHFMVFGYAQKLSSLKSSKINKLYGG